MSLHKIQQRSISMSATTKQGLSTIAAIDNIDHIQSSATASSSFHGTTISIFQKV